ncbi:MAG TPA: hypothetical protein VL551_10655 [Actinospica sp.]|jgi:hypothetical protein|nr:hypothetical protein [Actinospica sp.]
MVRTAALAVAACAATGMLAACASEKGVPVESGTSATPTPSATSSYTRPAKPASEQIPDSASLTVALHIVPGTTDTGARSVTLTDATKIAQIAAEINALPTQPKYPKVYCPMEIDGPYLTLDFRDSATGPVLAHVKVPPKASGMCSPAIQVTVNGVTEPALDDASQPTLYTRLLQTAGLNAR